MTLQQIQCFLIAAKKLNFTETARALYISQPAVSRQISLLEEELKFKLFHRNKSTLSLTSAGEDLFDFFQTTSHQFQEILTLHQPKADRLQGTVTLGSPDGWNLKSLNDYVVSHLARQYPYVHFHIKYYNHHELVEAFQTQNIDFILDQQELFESISDISVHPVRKLSCALYYCKNHPAASPNPSITDFKDYPFYLTAPIHMHKLSSNIIACCNSFGFTPKIEAVNTLSAAFVKLLSEDGVFLADTELILKDTSLFQILPLEYGRTVCLGVPTQKNPLHTAVEEILFSYFSTYYGIL